MPIQRWTYFKKTAISTAQGLKQAYVAERQGFEPWVPEGTPDFESGPFDQLWHLSAEA